MVVVVAGVAAALRVDARVVARKLPEAGGDGGGGAYSLHAAGAVAAAGVEKVEDGDGSARLVTARKAVETRTRLAPVMPMDSAAISRAFLRSYSMSSS